MTAKTVTKEKTTAKTTKSKASKSGDPEWWAGQTFVSIMKHSDQKGNGRAIVECLKSLKGKKGWSGATCTPEGEEIFKNVPELKEQLEKCTAVWNLLEVGNPQCVEFNSSHC